MILLKLAFRNIHLNFKHSLAAVIAVASGIIGLCIFQGYIDDISRLHHQSFSNLQMYGDIIIEHKLLRSPKGKSNPLKYGLDQEYQKKIEQFFSENPRYKKTLVPFLHINGMITNGRENTIFDGQGYNINEGQDMREKSWEWDTMYGIPLHKNQDPNSIVIGYNLSRLLNCKEDKSENFYDHSGGFTPIERPFHCNNTNVQLTVTTEGEQVNAQDFIISGMVNANYKEIDNKFIQISLKNAQSLMNTNKISYYTLKLKSELEQKSFLINFAHFSKSNNLNLLATPWLEHPVGEICLKTMEFLIIFRNFIVTVILFIAALSIFNTMVKIVKERTREIGTLRSIGFSRANTIKIFILESAFLSFIGSFCGIAVSLVTSEIINHLNIPYKAGVLTLPVIFKIEESFTLYIISSCLLLTITIFTTYIAVYKTVHKKIIENLSHV